MLVSYFLFCTVLVDPEVSAHVQTAARGRSGVGRLEKEAGKPENQANGIGDCGELLVSSTGSSLTGRDNARAMLRVPRGSIRFAQAAAGSGEGLQGGDGG